MLALKELLNGKVRFGLIALAVGLVVALTMLMSAMSEGLITGMTGSKGSLKADALVFQGDTQLALERSLLSARSVSAVDESPGVESAYPVGHAMISVSAAGSEPDGAEASGADVGDDGASFDARLFGLGGEWEQLPQVEGKAGPPGPGEAIVDITAKVDGIELGNTVSLTPIGRELTVVGFTENRRYIMVPTFYVDMATWEEVYLATALGKTGQEASAGGEDVPEGSEQTPGEGTSPALRGSASIVAVELAEGVSPADLEEQLGSGFEVATPEDAALAGNGMSVMVLATDGIQWVSLVIGALFIGVFFYITTLHKTGQIAAMKALGASNVYLYRQLLIQIAVLVTIAAAIGMFLSLGAGMSMPPTMAFDPQPVGWGLSLLAVYVMALVGSFFSLHTILRVDPATALDRGEH